MIEKRPGLTVLSHLVLILGVVIVAFPLYLTFIASTQSAAEIAQSVPMSMWPGSHALETYKTALFGGETSAGSRIPAAAPMMWVSLISALVIAIGKIVISLLSAFAIVYFRFPLRNLVFWMIFVTLMLPVEVRIGPTYEVVSNLGMLNSYAGLTVPLIASATATFLFRQFFLTVPDELVEAAPLLVTTNEDMYPVVMGIKRLIAGEAYTEWNVVMATAILAMLPPALVVILMQKWFVKGLVDTEK
jgi:sn-glycerol 3-phosphate transport system permease protein